MRVRTARIILLFSNKARLQLLTNFVNKSKLLVTAFRNFVNINSRLAASIYIYIYIYIEDIVVLNEQAKSYKAIRVLPYVPFCPFVLDVQCIQFDCLTSTKSRRMFTKMA